MNINFVWEIKEIVNIGFDVSFFNLCLIFSVEYYYLKIKDVLMEMFIVIFIGN